MMTNAGIDATVYKPHSVRSAAASNASLLEIMDVAGWGSASTFY